MKKRMKKAKAEFEALKHQIEEATEKLMQVKSEILEHTEVFDYDIKQIQQEIKLTDKCIEKINLKFDEVTDVLFDLNRISHTHWWKW